MTNTPLLGKKVVASRAVTVVDKAPGIPNNFVEQLMVHVARSEKPLAVVAAQSQVDKHVLVALKNNMRRTLPEDEQIVRLAHATGCKPEEMDELVRLAYIQRDRGQVARTVGREAREIRERLGIAIEDFARAISTAVHKLEAIEEGALHMKYPSILHFLAALTHFGATEHDTDRVAASYGLNVPEVKHRIRHVLAGNYSKGKNHLTKIKILTDPV